jgi:hypothetical protein
MIGAGVYPFSSYCCHSGTMNGPEDSFSDKSETPESTAERGPARAAPRSSLFLLTVVNLSGGSTTRARVRNLSATGLMADCEKPIAQGQRVSITLRGIGDVEGVIAWSEEDRIGIAFDSQIDPSLTRKPVGQSPADVPDYLRTLARTNRR